MAINLTKPKPTVAFSKEHETLFPLTQPEKKYPKELAVFQNIFWKLTHEKPLKDDLLKLLFFFSPKIRQVEDSLLSERQIFTISAKEYAEQTGLKKESCYVLLNRAVDSLYEHSVKFFHEESGQYLRCRLINSCGYKEGVFSVSFTHYALYIMSVFNKDNPFTKFTIKYAMGLNGYALKLYPMFVQNDFRHTFDVAIFDLKKALNIDADAYSEFKEFKKFVLKPSIESINEKTELNVTYKAVKKGGRKATHIEFTVTKATSKVNEPATSEPATSEPAITAMILFSHIQKNALIERLKEYGESTDEFIARLKVDLRDGKQQYWLQKLEEFGVSL